MFLHVLRALAIFLVASSVVGQEARQVRSGYTVNLYYPTIDGIDKTPDQRLGYFFLDGFPFTLLSHKRNGRFQELINPLRYEAHATFVAERAGSYTIVLDARIPPLLVFGRIPGQTVHENRTASILPTLINPHRKLIRPTIGTNRVFNMVEASYLECEFYYLVDETPVVRLEFQSQFPVRVPSQQLGDYRHKQRCGDRKQTLGNVHLDAGVHTARFGAQCNSTANFVEEAFHSRTRFAAVESCPRDYNHWTEAHPYPGDGVKFIPIMRKPGSGEPVPMTARDTYFEDPR